MPDRSQFLYKHIAKTGGGTVKAVLHMTHKNQIDQNIFIKKEREVSSESDRQRAFIVSNVRNPCEFYVSLWAFGCSGHGLFNSVLRREHPEAADVYSSPYNHSNFARFLGLAAGEFSRRYHDYLPGMPVDCWIHTETLAWDLIHCMGVFHKQGGKLSNVPTAEFIERVSTHGTEHEPCASYYTPELSDLVLRKDSAVFAWFPEYHNTCCMQVHNPNTSFVTSGSNSASVLLNSTL